MKRFCYRAVEEFGYIKKPSVFVALNEQIKQEWKQNGQAEPVGEILVKKGLLTRDQLDNMLKTNLMEPNIRWGKETRFAKMLNIEKSAKQAIGCYIGKRVAGQPEGITVFMGNSSTVYYAFRGMVKHKARVNVETIHAAILAAYPSFKSNIKSVSTVWKGHVDLDDALIEPPDLGDLKIREGLGFLHGVATHAIISATGFDSHSGPMATHPAAREVSRLAMQSGTRTCVLIDHTKIRMGISETDPNLLFEIEEWNEIRPRKHVEVIVNCHPNMPAKQASFKPAQREASEIRNELTNKKFKEEEIDRVVKYHNWTMRMRDILQEIPFR